jgi:hypothetical protein
MGNAGGISGGTMAPLTIVSMRLTSMRQAVWQVASTGRANGGIVTYCVNEGTITGEDSNIGGIAGDVEDKTSLTHSYNRGKVTGKGYCGGIVGMLWNGTVSDCYSTDSVRSLGSY